MAFILYLVIMCFIVTYWLFKRFIYFNNILYKSACHEYKHDNIFGNLPELGRSFQNIVKGVECNVPTNVTSLQNIVSRNRNPTYWSLRLTTKNYLTLRSLHKNESIREHLQSFRAKAGEWFGLVGKVFQYQQFMVEYTLLDCIPKRRFSCYL